MSSEENKTKIAESSGTIIEVTQEQIIIQLDNPEKSIIQKSLSPGECEAFKLWQKVLCTSYTSLRSFSEKDKPFYISAFGQKATFPKFVPKYSLEITDYTESQAHVQTGQHGHQSPKERDDFK